MMEKSDKFIEKAQKIRWFFTDVDGTLTDGRVYYSSEGEQLKTFSLRDGAGFFLLRQVGIKTGIITTECSPIVAQRAKKLHVDAYISGAEKKGDVMLQFIETHQLNWEEIAYIGDEVNDCKLIEECGLTFAVADAADIIKQKADIVCKCVGGQHAFREAVGVLLNLREVDVDEIIQKSL